MKSILVGLDGSERAPRVLAAAVALARVSQGKLILFRSVGMPAEIPHETWNMPEGSLIGVLSGKARQYLEEEAKSVPPEILGALKVAIGSPWQAICEEAAKDAVDLIIIGSHGYGMIDRMLGTTAAKVVNHADCSVLVVRQPSAATKK